MDSTMNDTAFYQCGPIPGSLMGDSNEQANKEVEEKGSIELYIDCDTDELTQSSGSFQSCMSSIHDLLLGRPDSPDEEGFLSCPEWDDVGSFSVDYELDPIDELELYQKPSKKVLKKKRKSSARTTGKSRKVNEEVKLQQSIPKPSIPKVKRSKTSKRQWRRGERKRLKSSAFLIH